MSVMILDAGNSIVKAKIANGEIAFPHAIQALTEGEYQKIISRASINGNSTDYIRINGKPYVVGESARVSIHALRVEGDYISIQSPSKPGER